MTMTMTMTPRRSQERLHLERGAPECCGRSHAERQLDSMPTEPSRIHPHVISTRFAIGEHFVFRVRRWPLRSAE